jgi:hypothetical protein
MQSKGKHTRNLAVKRAPAVAQQPLPRRHDSDRIALANAQAALLEAEVLSQTAYLARCLRLPLGVDMGGRLLLFDGRKGAA